MNIIKNHDALELAVENYRVYYLRLRKGGGTLGIACGRYINRSS
jgi:hypothetical protein